jgi:NAD(P)H-dependent FMN reductase
MRDAAIVRAPAISGSLRGASSNTAVINAAIRVAPLGVDASAYSDLADLPPLKTSLAALAQAARAGAAR